MRLLLLAIVFSLLAQGCKQNSSSEPEQKQHARMFLPTNAQPRLETTRLWLGAEELIAELALTPKQVITGMMFRTNIAENEAMLFVFPYPERKAFWMTNVPVPLSLAYIDPAGVILEIHDLKPHDATSVFSASDRVQYVLETAQGWFARHSVGTGTVVRTEKGSLADSFRTGAPRQR